MRLLPSSFRASRLSPSSPPTGPGWAHELKHDGYRLQIHVRDDRVRLYTINGADWSETLPADWLRLIRSENIGPRTFRDLVTYYGGVRPALAALPGLARRGGSPRPPYICSREEAERELKAARAIGVEYLMLGEAEYPSRLQMIDDPPPVVALRGKLAVFDSAADRDCRLAERLGGRREIRRTHRA